MQEPTHRHKNLLTVFWCQPRDTMIGVSLATKWLTHGSSAYWTSPQLVIHTALRQYNSLGYIPYRLGTHGLTYTCTLRPAMANLFWFQSISKILYVHAVHTVWPLLDTSMQRKWKFFYTERWCTCYSLRIQCMCSRVVYVSIMCPKNWPFGALSLENLLLSVFYYIITELNSLQCGLLCCRDPLAPCSNSFESLKDNEWLNLLTNEIYEQVITSLTDKVHK